jgi:hypothetical protein
MKKTRSHTSWLPLLAIGTISVVAAGIYLYYRLRPIAVASDIMQVTIPGGKVNLAFSDAAPTLMQGETKELDLVMNTYDQKVTGVQVELTYDQTKLEVPVVTRGPFLPKSLSDARIENGKITFTYIAEPGTGGVTGRDVIAKFHLKLKPGMSGSTTLAITSNTKIAVLGWNRNALNGAYDTVITAAAPQVLYFYLKDTKTCQATNNKYTDLAACVTNLKIYAAGRTTETCFTSLTACRQANGLQ